MTSALVLGSAFVTVFCLGLQSQNVNQGHYVAAVVTSLFISTGSMYLYQYMTVPTLADKLCFYIGAASGIAFSIWFHRRFRAWWRAWRAPVAHRPRGQFPPKPPPPLIARPACQACGLPAGASCPRLVCERYLDEHADVLASTRLH